MQEAKPICVIYVNRHIDITSDIQIDLAARLPDYHVFVLAGTTHQQAVAKFKVYNNRNVTEIDAASLKQLILQSITPTP